MRQAVLAAASTSAWSGLSLVDNTVVERPNQIVLNNSLNAVHSVAGISANQQLGDIFEVINRGVSDLLLAAENTTADAKDRFLSAIYLPAGGKVQMYYNGTRWEPFADLQGAVISKLVNFVENAANTVHTGSVVIPAGAWLHGIEVTSSALWGATSASMKVGDAADDDGYFTGINLKATDLLVGESLDTNPSTGWGGKEGAYLVAATGRRGPVATNFAKYYPAGTTIAGIITVGTPAVTTGRTHMLVRYSVGPAITATPSA